MKNNPFPAFFHFSKIFSERHLATHLKLISIAEYCEIHIEFKRGVISSGSAASRMTTVSKGFDNAVSCKTGSGSGPIMCSSSDFSAIEGAKTVIRTMQTPKPA